MFDSKKNLSARLTDAVDLMIDFATLGEYGLEPVGGQAPPACESRHRPTVALKTDLSRRPGSPAPSSGPSPRRTRIEGPFLLRP
jgi:hypothetical protein